MEFIKPGVYIDFMRYRKVVILVSILTVIGSLVLIVFPGPNYGIDFRGGTEIQLAFKGKVSAGELRSTLGSLGYSQPEVLSVEDRPNEFIVRIQEVSSLADSKIKQIKSKISSALGQTKIKEFKLSPGGDKISLRLSGVTNEALLTHAVHAAGVKVRSASRFGSADQFRYEIRLQGVADKIVDKLQSKLGSRGPEAPRRVEWVGPKAGEQLRTAALQSLLYAVAFIMVYVAFRFDLRFAPGGVLAMVHDAIITIGLFVLLRKEINLSTVAALLTIMGYSINDTIVIFDRIRENMQRMRDKSLRELINISTSQMLSRTITTSGTTVLSVSAFFIWGTPVIQDIALAMVIGVVVGTYSSIYIAAPVTEWMDRRFFRAGISR
ncbi:MAG: protein translocase subunit SecF [Myxococcales bacterium]|nr:MAG: protein translocase subunit SecF [Myxococcales bacterium]